MYMYIIVWSVLYCAFSLHIAALFQLLMKILSSTEGTPVADRLSSLASSCLVSLVLALGQTSKILAAIAALLIAPPILSENHLKVRYMKSA